MSPGRASDPDGVWAPEDSRLVFGVDRQAAAGLAADFDQNAIVWMGSRRRAEGCLDAALV